MNSREQPRPDDGPATLGDVGATVDWLAGLRRFSVNQAVPHLLTRLEALLRADLTPAIRLDMLKLLKRPLLKATAALPAPDPRLPHSGLPQVAGLSVEQRLDAAMRNNLRVLFFEIDRHRFRADALGDEDRQWVLRNLFKFFRRQVRYALLARQECPSGTWQALHDLFVYLVIRGNVRIDESLAVDFLDDAFDPQLEYKRLLLMGRAHQYDLEGSAMLAMIGHLTEWASRSKLLDPTGLRGSIMQLLVEVAQDRPLRLDAECVQSTFRGWVLDPDRRFVRFCEEHRRSHEPFALAADNPFRAYLLNA